MSWLLAALNLYIIYYTISYALKLYTVDKNKLGGIMSFLVALSLIILPLLIRYRIIGSE